MLKIEVMNTADTFSDGWSNGSAPEAKASLPPRKQQKRKGKSSVKLGEGLLD
jgi:hypothetical protein